MQEYGHQCVVWQTAINPVVALELLARGTWTGAGVLGPEAFDAVPFLDLLTEYGSPWGQKVLDPAYIRHHEPGQQPRRSSRFRLMWPWKSALGVATVRACRWRSRCGA